MQKVHVFAKNKPVLFHAGAVLGVVLGPWIPLKTLFGAYTGDQVRSLPDPHSRTRPTGLLFFWLIQALQLAGYRPRILTNQKMEILWLGGRYCCLSCSIWKKDGFVIDIPSPC
jgi:hypothetical protein